MRTTSTEKTRTRGKKNKLRLRQWKGRKSTTSEKTEKKREMIKRINEHDIYKEKEEEELEGRILEEERRGREEEKDDNRDMNEKRHQEKRRKREEVKMK